MPSSVIFASLAFVSLCLAPATAFAFDQSAGTARSDEPSVADQIRGAWVTYRDTPSGRYMTTKEHFGDHSVVTTYDPQKKPILSHRSEYRVDVSGAVPIFRYGNRVALLGPDAGAKDNREAAYIFRVDGDHFYEIHGMLPGDKGKPSLRAWERLKNHPVPKPET